MSMSLEIFANHKKTFLFPVALEDFVPKDHPARFIRAFVESLDLNALGFAQRIAKEGRPSYSADLMLSIWIYGFFMKIRSSRNLEKACMDSVGMIWLTGMNYPDHNSIWRFFKKNREAIKKVFKQSVLLANSMELVSVPRIYRCLSPKNNPPSLFMEKGQGDEVSQGEGFIAIIGLHRSSIFLT